MWAKNKRLIVDIDGTITVEDNQKEYHQKEPNSDLISKLHEYKNSGFEIILMTARNMNTHEGDVSKINKFTAPILLKWLSDHNVPFDGIIYAKPWCGKGGFYIDDKAIRPSEFIEKSYDEIIEIIK